MFKQLKSLEMPTGYKGFLLLNSDDDNSIVYGGTDQELVAKFEDGSALLQMNEIKRKSKRDCKKVDMCKIMDRIITNTKQFAGLVKESPLPSPSKLPNCLTDLAATQQKELANLSINFEDSTFLHVPPVIKKKKSTVHVTIEKSRGGKKGRGRGKEN